MSRPLLFTEIPASFCTSAVISKPAGEALGRPTSFGLPCLRGDVESGAWSTALVGDDRAGPCKVIGRPSPSRSQRARYRAGRQRSRARERLVEKVPPIEVKARTGIEVGSASTFDTTYVLVDASSASNIGEDLTSDAVRSPSFLRLRSATKRRSHASSAPLRPRSRDAHRRQQRRECQHPRPRPLRSRSAFSGRPTRSATARI